ncbi:oligosaccharide flippase family protein [Alsobacter sp. KACC 23698]|uniref:Oligosaccharide flippase family protein n=1 Tax=Alsobacter sp. KACC 23698 TaxID=3149229 RepID=A0AAU7JIM3_9HYPH
MLRAQGLSAARRLRVALTPKTAMSARLLSGGLFSLAGALVTRSFGFALSLLIVRLLGRERFGEFTMVQSTLGVLGTAAGMGLSATATKFIAEHRDQAPDRAGAVLGLVNASALTVGLLIGVLCYAGADLLAAHVLKRPELGSLLRVAALAIPITTLEGVQSASLAGLEAFRRLAQISVAAAAVSLPVYVLGVYSDGLRGAVQAQVAGAGIALTLSCWACRAECQKRGLRTNYGSMLAESRLIWLYSLPALGGGLTYLTVFWAANLILVQAPDGYLQLGTLRVVDQLRTMLVALPTVMLAPTFAIMANTVHQPAVLAKILEHSVASAGLIVFPAGLALTFCGPQLLAFLYGSDMAGSGVALACAMVVAGAQATGLGLGNVLSATGRMWLGFALNLFWGLLFLGLCLALIPSRGTSGFLIALAAAYLALNALAYASFLARNSYLRPGRVFIPLGGYIAAVAAGVGVVPHLEPRLALAAGAGAALLMAICLARLARKALTPA